MELAASVVRTARMVARGEGPHALDFDTTHLGGGNSNIFGIFTPKPWGFMIQFD